MQLYLLGSLMQVSLPSPVNLPLGSVHCKMNDRQKRTKRSETMGLQQIFFRAMTVISHVTTLGKLSIPCITPFDCISSPTWSSAQVQTIL